ncbi:MAG: PD-(D/E)XK nuclease family protein [Acidobacteriota bacterium]
MSTNGRPAVLNRCPDLRALRAAVLSEITRAWETDPLAVRRIAFVFRNVQGASLAKLAIEEMGAALGRCSFLLPIITTADQFWTDLHGPVRRADPILREALLSAQTRRMESAGITLPFMVHPGVLKELLALDDDMSDNGVGLDEFEAACREAFGGSLDDPGAQRAEQLGAFVVSALRGLHAELQRLGLAGPARIRSDVSSCDAPCEVVHVMDPLPPADLRAFAQISNLRRLEIWATVRQCRAGLQERIANVLPSIEAREIGGSAHRPALIAHDGGPVFIWRDREDDLTRTAILIKQLARDKRIRSLERAAVVFSRPLPYVYLAKQSFSLAKVPFQMADTYPLSVEPWAGAVDLILQFVSGGFRREDGIALLSSPFFDLRERGTDGALATVYELADELRGERFIAGRAGWEGRGIEMGDLDALARDGPVYQKAQTLMQMVEHRRRRDPEEPDRHRRARAAVMSILASIASAYVQAGPTEAARPAGFRALVRRWIDAHTFTPRLGGEGAHLVDVDSARHGDFDHVFIVGLVADEWPRKPRPNILFPRAFLSRLGWESEAYEAAMQRAQFLDLVESAGATVALSAFSLEEDTPTSRSPFIEQVPELDTAPVDRGRIARTVVDPAAALAFGLAVPSGSPWQSLRAVRSRLTQAQFAARISADPVGTLSPSGMELYLRCPFLLFAQKLGLKSPDGPDERWSGPERGTMLHRVMHDFYEAWDAAGVRPVLSVDWSEFQATFVKVLEIHLPSVPQAERGIERARYTGSMMAAGIIEKVFRAELAGGVNPRQRWLEFEFDGRFELRGAGDAAEVSIDGRIDRLELAVDGRARVIDYKLSNPPSAKVAVQPWLYAACVEQLSAAGELPAMEGCDGLYYPFGKDTIATARSANMAARDAAIGRALSAIRGMEAGRYSPRPYSPHICGYCDFYRLCRKEIE